MFTFVETVEMWKNLTTWTYIVQIRFVQIISNLTAKILENVTYIL